ncbi:MAG: AbrB/MazE/SpoVT family DNA-binding domain-containing protein [Deltaproteobacteria bacterium]|nr:AbrB/MazE/SpoVT family DNA-binding domain-containing protein [Deltaproteobacteria bacterium]
MTQTIRLTSKRQATFPVQLCRELGIEAGDDLILERKKIGKDFAWILKPKKKIESKWFASLKKYAKDKDNSMESIRASIGKSIGNIKK